MAFHLIGSWGCLLTVTWEDNDKFNGRQLMLEI